MNMNIRAIFVHLLSNKPRKNEAIDKKNSPLRCDAPSSLSTLREDTGCFMKTKVIKVNDKEQICALFYGLIYKNIR